MKMKDLKKKYKHLSKNIISEPFSACPICNGSGETSGFIHLCFCTNLPQGIPTDKKIALLEVMKNFKGIADVLIKDAVDKSIEKLNS